MNDLAPSATPPAVPSAPPPHHPADLVSQHLLPGVGVLFAVYLAALLVLVLVTVAVKVRLGAGVLVTGRVAAHRAHRAHRVLAHRVLAHRVVVLPVEELTPSATVAGGAS